MQETASLLVWKRAEEALCMVFQTVPLNEQQVGQRDDLGPGYAHVDTRTTEATSPLAPASSRCGALWLECGLRAVPGKSGERRPNIGGGEPTGWGACADTSRQLVSDVEAYFVGVPQGSVTGDARDAAAPSCERENWCGAGPSCA